MQTHIHRKARNIFFQLPFLGPLKKYFTPPSIDIDLSNNTNAYLDPFAHYPDPLQHDLKQHYWDVISTLNHSVTSSLQGQHKHKRAPDHILFTVGSCEGIDLLLRTFAEPNQDAIVVTTPSFSAYEHWGRIHNLKIHQVPLLGDQYDRFSVSDILAFNPKLVFLCNPNNPTGTLLNLDLIHELCQSPQFHGFVVIDEAYIEFSNSPSMIHELHRYENLIVLRTLSKGWGLADIRCGAILADPDVIFTLRYIQVPFGFPGPCQGIVKERCLSPQVMHRSWEKTRQERDKLSLALKDLECVDDILESHTNFLLMKLKNHPATMALLNNHHIYVMDCSAIIPNSIRVTIGTEGENARFLEVMKSS